MARFLSLGVMFLPFATAAAQDLAALDADERAALVDRLGAHLDEHARAPIPFIAGELGEHDVVVLGEVHGVRQTTDFVAALIPRLYHDAGLRVFATEFLRQRLTEQANALVNAEHWDRAAMIELMRRGPWPTWGYEGYLEIYAAIWKLNRSIPEGEDRLELVGLDSDWSQYDRWFGDMSRTEVFQDDLERERTMTAAVRKHGLEAEKKTLVHIGFAHSVTCQGVRLATVLTKEFGDRVVQIGVHHALKNTRGEAPISDLLEELCGDEARAFAVRGTPLGGLRDPAWPFARALPNGELGDLAQNLVYLTPAAKQQRERWIEGFITDATFAQANRISVRMGFVQEGECENATELDAKLAERF